MKKNIFLILLFSALLGLIVHVVHASQLTDEIDAIKEQRLQLDDFVGIRNIQKDHAHDTQFRFDKLETIKSSGNFNLIPPNMKAEAVLLYNEMKRHNEVINDPNRLEYYTYK